MMKSFDVCEGVVSARLWCVMVCYLLGYRG